MDKDLEIENLKKALKRQKQARKEAEAFMESKSLELYISNNKLTKLIANTNRFPEENPNPVMRFSAKTKLLMYSNNSGKSIIDYLDDKRHAETKLIFDQQIEYAFVKGESYQFELDFGRFTYIINAVPFVLNNYINVYANDISAIKRANEAVRKSEEKYRGIIENLELGILEVDNEDKIIKAYPQFCSLLGYMEDELIGKSPIDLLLDDSYHEMMYRENEKRLVGISSVYEVPLIKKNGDVVWVIISGAPFYNSDGSLEGTIGVHLDITDRREMEAVLREAKSKAEELNKIKEMFLANMSHEIRTPMNAIVGMSELLSQTSLDSVQSKYLAAISSSSKNLLVLINDLLDFSKIESGKLSLELVDFDLTKLIEKNIGIVKLKAEDNGVNILSNIDKGIPKILKGDPTRLGQVLLNLLSNAVKFTLNGTVTLSASVVRSVEDKYFVKFLVKDEGIGIPKKELTNIFKDFSQAKESTTRLYGGTGLGLSISQKIVSLMDGKLEVSSELNEGSEFFFTVGFEGVELGDSEKDGDDYYELVMDFSQGNILLVEDNPVNSLMATTILEKWNCVVHLAENGIEAIEKLKKQSFDLVLMDMNMPKMGGIEASKIIRKDLEIETPIIALTANAIKGDNDKCFEAGMNDYLSKPYRQIELNQILKKWMDIDMDSKVEPLYDLSKLEEMEDPEFLERMVKLFLVETRKEIVTLKGALEESNFQLIKSIAHKVKPSINYVCGVNLFEEAKAIENWEGEDATLIEKTKLFIRDLGLVLEQLDQIQ